MLIGYNLAPSAGLEPAQFSFEAKDSSIKLRGYCLEEVEGFEPSNRTYVD